MVFNYVPSLSNSYISVQLPQPTHNLHEVHLLSSQNVIQALSQNLNLRHTQDKLLSGLQAISTSCSCYMGVHKTRYC